MGGLRFCAAQLLPFAVIAITGCVAETLVGTRLHFLVGELSSCAEAVDLSSTELSADALSCLEAPLRGLSALAANRSDARAPAPIEDEPRPAGPPDGDAAPPIWPNTSARRLLQQNLCGSGEVRYETACGVDSSCNSGDREIGVTCDGCGVTCVTWPIAAGTKEICCRKPTPSPSAPQCTADEIKYETSCGVGSIGSSCNLGDREIGVTCDGCGVTCVTWPIASGTKEICCRKPTPMWYSRAPRKPRTELSRSRSFNED